MGKGKDIWRFGEGKGRELLGEEGKNQEAVTWAESCVAEMRRINGTWRGDEGRNQVGRRGRSDAY